MRTTILAAATALCGVTPIFAQAPVNDDCANAVAVVAGPNGPFDNIGATSFGAAMPCSVAGMDSDVWFSFVAPCSNVTVSTCGADFDSKIEILTGQCPTPASIACRDDGPCGLQQKISFTAVNGSTYLIRVGGFSGAQGTFPLHISCNSGYGILAVAEFEAGSGTLRDSGGDFIADQRLRWNHRDPGGTFRGLPGAMVLNVGLGGSPPIGFTPQIPGYGQLWPGSTPAGSETVLGPFLIGGADQSVLIPANLFNNGDTVRLQGLVLDPARALGAFPAVPSDNVIEFAYIGSPGSCVEFEGFELATLPALPNGWTDGGGTGKWRTNVNTTPSGSTGPNRAAEGAVYLYCETSLPIVANDRFIIDSPLYTSPSLTTLEFDLSRVGTAIGTLDVLLDDGSNQTLLTTYAGPDPNQVPSAPWTRQSIALPSPLPASYRFRFAYTAGSGGTFLGDIAIDAVCVR